MVRSVKGISGDRSEPVMYAVIYDYGMAPRHRCREAYLANCKEVFFLLL
jgi:hypothetical protein